MTSPVTPGEHNQHRVDGMPECLDLTFHSVPPCSPLLHAVLSKIEPQVIGYTSWQNTPESQVNTAALVFPALVSQVLLGAVPACAFLPPGLLLCQSHRFDPLLQKTFLQCFLHHPSYRRAFCIHRCNTSL